MNVNQFVRVFLLLIAVTMFTVSCDKDLDANSDNTESGGKEAGESGKMWNRSETANETVKGVNLVLKFDEASQSFKGTLENLNTVVAPQVRVEVHVYDAAGKSIEFGPTQPGDMQPGSKKSVTLPTPKAGNFVKFQMHAEVGTSTGGGGEGSEGTGHEGEAG